MIVPLEMALDVLDALVSYVETHEWAALLLMALCALACMSADSWFA